MNQIYIENPRIKGNLINFELKVKGEWGSYFRKNPSFSLEYPEDMTGLPISIASVSLLSNLLPIAWVFDGQIILDQLDQDFFLSIPEIKKGYQAMYPELLLKGSLKVNKIIKNSHQADQTASFFSGGLDAYHTLYSHIEEKPSLISVWGADIKTTNQPAWELAYRHILETAGKYGLKSYYIKSTFREFIHENLLSDYVIAEVGDNWWNGFQHGIGLLGLAAPLAYLNNWGKIYFASTYTDEDKQYQRITTASDPTIDNCLKFSSTSIQHDGYHFSRQDKMAYIINYLKENNDSLHLRVCFHTQDGNNCGHCEKCGRTILNILAEGEDPSQYGFNYNQQDLAKIMQDLKIKKMVEIFDYIPIQRRLRERYSFDEISPELRWFYKSNIRSLNKNMGKYIFRLYRKLLVKS